MRKIYAAALSLIICTAFIFGIFYFTGVGKLTEKRASKKYTKPSSKFVVLPQINQCGLFKLEENKLKLVTQLPFSPCAKTIIGENDWIVSIPEKQDKLQYCIYQNERLTKVSDLELADGFKAHSIALKRNILYVGGSSKKELIGFFDLSANKPVFKTINIPEHLKRYGKSIDGIFVDENRLIAVDDVVLPKWLLVYKISKLLKPALKSSHKLKTHGTWERVEASAIDEKWIAIISVTSSMGGPGQHLSIYEKRDFTEYLSIGTQPIPYEKPLPPWPGANDWFSVVCSDGLILIAAGKDGLGVLDMTKKTYSTSNRDEMIKQFWFVSFGEFKNGKVIDIININSSGWLGVVYEINGNINTQLTNTRELLQAFNEGNFRTFEEINKRDIAYWENRFR